MAQRTIYGRKAARFSSVIAPANTIDSTITPGYPGSDCKYWASRPKSVDALGALSLCVALTGFGRGNFLFTLIVFLPLFVGWLAVNRRWKNAAIAAVAKAKSEAVEPVAPVPASPVPEPRRPEQATAATLQARVRPPHADAPATIPFDPVGVGADYRPHPHPAAEIPSLDRRRAPARAVDPTSPSDPAPAAVPEPLSDNATVAALPKRVRRQRSAVAAVAPYDRAPFAPESGPVAELPPLDWFHQGSADSQQ
jgi:hypothetical protein